MRAEAAYALNKYKLVPIAIDNSAPPLRGARVRLAGAVPVWLSVPVVTIITVPIRSVAIGITRAAVVAAVRRICAISAT